MHDDSILQTAQRNKQNYLDAKAACNRRDLDACLAHYAPDHQIMSRPSPKGREQTRRFFEESFATWPDIHAAARSHSAPLRFRRTPCLS